jgi:hypothetical protein
MTRSRRWTMPMGADRSEADHAGNVARLVGDSGGFVPTALTRLWPLTLAAICVWFASESIAMRAAQRPALSAEAIDDAITIGSRHMPEPYELVWRTGAHEEGTTVVGNVYTPFIRVALWAYEREKSAGQPPDASEIPPDLVSPTLTIALRLEPACCPAVEPGVPLRVYAALFPSPSRHVLLCTDPLQGREEVLDVSTDLSLLRRFDPERANGTAAIVTVPLARVQSGWDIVYEMHRREAGGTNVLHFVGFGMIRDNDIASWR